MLNLLAAFPAKLFLNKRQSYPLLAGFLRAVPLANQTL